MNYNTEYLLNPENNRLTVYPIKNESIWAAYKKQQAAFWTAEEIDFSKDYDHFIQLNSNEQHFIKMILAFFSSSDTIVNINLGERFSSDVKIREAIVTYDFQKMMENVHSETYSLQIDNIIKDPEEKDKLFNAVREYECIAEKAKWAMKWIESTESFAMRLIAFAIVEGVFFSGSFCSIFWLKKRNVMPGLCKSNELISRDEGMHTNFAILLYSMLTNKIEESRVHDMFKEAVEIEKVFITESLPVKLIGMNSEMMKEYIEYVADYWLSKLNYSKVFHSKNPFDFMSYISLQDFGNFFETRISAYRKHNVGVEESQKQFSLDEDF
jgi:ribonucleoside-diphosphate reductase beta chain